MKITKNHFTYLILDVNIFVIIKYEDNKKYFTYLILDINSKVENKILFLKNEVFFLYYHNIMYYFVNHKI